jgi:Lhr-like helicase
MAFSKLHPKIQEAIWNQKWEERRPLQVEALEAVSGSNNHLILAAATASGKTEAALYGKIPCFIGFGNICGHMDGRHLRVRIPC